MRLIVVQHGETEWNKLELLQGHTDIPLNENGQRQAAILGQHLQSEPISIAFSSDLQRAVQTASAILKYHPSVNLEKTVLLRERTYGIYEGRYNDEWRKAVENSGLLSHLFRPEHGETILDVQKRALSFYDSLFQRFSSETILVVVHGGVLRSLLLGLDGGSFDLETQKRYIHQNTAYTIINIDDSQKHRYEVFNSTDHLQK